LQDHGDLGTVDEPGQFFWGLLPMQWGPIVTHDGATLLYFGGRDERTIVGLGGSAEARPRDGAPRAASAVPSLLPVLLDAIDDRFDDEASHEAADQPSRPPTTRPTAPPWLRCTGHGRLRGPAQNVEFIAKRLLSGPSPYPELDGRDGMTVLLGSPLYVALAD